MTRQIWGWALLGSLGWALVYADRAVFGPLLAPIGRAFHVGPAALGLLGTAFYLSYTVLQVPAGVLADRWRPSLTLPLSFLGFGLAVGLTAFAPSFGFLVGLTFAAGVFQSIYYPAQYAVTARTVPAEVRDRANAVINGGMGVGMAAGAAVGAIPLFERAWPELLMAAGALTVAVAAVLRLRTPVVQMASPGSRKGTVPFGRDLMLLSVVNFGSLFGFFFYLTWFPYYLETTAHITGGLLAALSALAPLVAAPAGVLWARVFGPRRLLGIRIFLPLAALSFVAIPMITAPALLFVPLVVYGLVGKLPTDPLILGEVAARLDRGALGAGFGVLNFAGMLASVVAPLISGILAERFHALGLAFDLSAALLLVSLLASFALGLRRGAGHDEPAPAA